MRLLRRLLGNIVRAALPPRWVRLLRCPALLPGYYRPFADEIERTLDLQRNAESFGDDYWAAIARKNAHILDKALQRPDFEPGRSKPYYDQAKHALQHISLEAMSRDPSVEWAQKKVNDYEQRQKSPGCDAKELPIDLPRDADVLLWQILRSRRSIRSYTDEPVTEEAIKKVAEAANWAPCSCNRQTVRVFATTDPGLIDACKSTCAGATCFKGTVPCFLSFCADLRAYSLPQEMWLPMVDVGLAVENCCLYAQTLGLSITLLSWAQSGVRDDAILRSTLRIPAHFRIVVNAFTGYVQYATETPLRKDVDSTCCIVNSKPRATMKAEQSSYEYSCR